MKHNDSILVGLAIAQLVVLVVGFGLLMSGTGFVSDSGPQYITPGDSLGIYGSAQGFYGAPAFELRSTNVVQEVVIDDITQVECEAISYCDWVLDSVCICDFGGDLLPNTYLPPIDFELAGEDTVEIPV